MHGQSGCLQWGISSAFMSTRLSRPPPAAEFCAKSSWTAGGTAPCAARSPRDFWGKNISGSPQYIKKAPRRSIVGGGGHPRGGTASPTAWGLQQLVMENHSAIRGLKISYRGAGACRWTVWQECRRGEAGRALEANTSVVRSRSASSARSTWTPTTAIRLCFSRSGAKRRAHGPAWLQLPGLEFAKLESFTKNAGRSNFNMITLCISYL